MQLYAQHVMMEYSWDEEPELLMVMAESQEEAKEHFEKFLLEAMKDEDMPLNSYELSGRGPEIWSVSQGDVISLTPQHIYK